MVTLFSPRFVWYAPAFAVIEAYPRLSSCVKHFIIWIGTSHVYQLRSKRTKLRPGIKIGRFCKVGTARFQFFSAGKIKN